jgi:hypothetical protein
MNSLPKYVVSPTLERPEKESMPGTNCSQPSSRAHQIVMPKRDGAGVLTEFQWIPLPAL